MPTATLSIAISGLQSTENLPETRGYYLPHSADFSPAYLREQLERIADAGFNLLVFPVYVNGHTTFPSETAKNAGLPSISPLFRKWDPLAETLDIANSLGLGVWGFARPYNFHPRHSLTPHRLLKKYPQWRLAIHPSHRGSPLGKREGYVACPVNHDYRRYLGDLFSEMVLGYPIDGLVLNYSGYGLRTGTLAEHPFCFCNACLEKFETEKGAHLFAKAATPEGVKEIRAWQTEMSRASLEYLRHRIMKSRRTLRLVCRAQPQWRWTVEEAGPALHRPYCIDWNSLLREGIIEELVIDHDEDVNAELFSSRLVSDLAELHHESLVLPSIRVTKPADLEAPLAAVRKYPVSGFVCEFANPMTAEDAAFIRDRYFAEPAHASDQAPLVSVSFLLRRVQANHADNELISDFMKDFLRLIERAYRRADSFHDLEIIFENLSGLQVAIRRGRLGRYPIPESTLRDIGLARRLIRVASLDVRT